MDVLQQLISNGNLVHFFAEERANGDHFPKLQMIGDELRKLMHSTSLRYGRIQQLQLPNNLNTARSSIVSGAKERGQMSDGLDWDTLMFKTIPSGGEYACILQSHLFPGMTELEVGIMQQMQIKLAEYIKKGLADAREDQETTLQEDRHVSDYDIMLEAAIGGKLDYFRKLDVQSRGDAELMNNVMLMVPAFILGILPGAVSPGKIMSSHDSVSLNLLQGSIRLIAEQQVYQISVASTSPEARAGMMGAITQKRGDGVLKMGKWTQTQQASTQVKHTITMQLNESMRALHMEYNNPAKDIAHYAAGGPNTLGDSLLMETQQSSVRLHMTPLQKELLSQSLSVLLACIRVRFDATRQSKIELVAQEDIDYLHVIERLAQYCEPNSHKFFTEITNMLAHTMGEGHNAVRLADKGQSDASIYERVIAGGVVLIEDLAKSVPLFNADIQEGKVRLTQLVKQIITSLAEENRWNREVNEIAGRRKITQTAVDAIIKPTEDTPMPMNTDPAPQQLLLEEKENNEIQS